VAVLALAGFNLNIINYWAVINGLYIDFISAANLVPGCSTLLSDRFGNANGAFSTASSCRVTAPTFNYFNGAGPFSITMWLYMNSASQRGIMDFTYNINDDIVISAFSTTFCSSPATKLGWSVYQGGSGSSVCLTPSISTAVWTHVAVTYSSGTQCVYLNGGGGCVYTGRMINSYSRNYNYFGYNTWGQYGSYGMDEIKFHGRVLSAAEIASDRAYGQSYISYV
jgi:hypothetical protein